ncbi:SlyX family protein [bacterium]|nr:SlyX family protein [bacterium]
MSNENQLIDIEIKIAHQDKTLEELSDVIYKQQQQIDSLEKSLKTLISRIQNGTNGELEIGPADEKPPHY